MSQILRAHTTAIVHIGPFVLSSCVIPPKPSTAIALGAVTAAEILRHAATSNVVDISGNTWGHIENNPGWYHLHLTADNTCEPGPLTVIVSDSSCLPVFARFQVVPENIYDAIYSTCGATYPVDLSDHWSVDVNSIVGDSCAADSLSQFTTDVVVDGGVNVKAINGATSAAYALTYLTSHTTDIISGNDSLLLISTDNAFVGTDGQILISADAQNLEDTLDVNAGAIAGDTCTANDLLTNSSLIANLDAAISTRSSHDSSDVWALASSYGGLTYNQLHFRTYSLLNELMEVSDVSGQAAIVRGGADIATATYTDDGTSTTRTQWSWSADT